MATKQSRSFGEILDSYKGAGPGFDLLRLALSITILFSHSAGISGQGGLLSSLLNHVIPGASHIAASMGGAPDIVDPVSRPVRGLARPYTLSHVPMFFALSGFLVTASALRTRNVVKFLGLRVLRILPALLVEVTLSALLLGTIFTTLPLNDYFRSPEFWAYFGNIVGDIHMRLPGVFYNLTPAHIVNTNLWTLPFEFDCYALSSVLMITTLFYRRMLLSYAFVIVTLAMLLFNTFGSYQVYAGQLRGTVVTYYFFVGMITYMWRYKIIYSWWLFGAAAALTFILMLSTKTVFVYPLMLTYVTVFIGLTPLPKFKLLQSGDYSYGIYLYGCPVTLALIASVPSLRGNLPATAIGAVILAGLFSAFSWHCVEKHFLKLKKYLSPRSAKLTEILHPNIDQIAHGSDSSELAAGKVGVDLPKSVP